MTDSDGVVPKAGEEQESVPTAQDPQLPEAKSPEAQIDGTLQTDHQRAGVAPQIIIQQPPPLSRDWVQIIVTALPGIAALIALIFTYTSLKGQLQANTDQLQATKSQLSIESQGQITDRFNTAVTNLGSSAVDVRIGGIYALQRIMVDSHRDQPAILEILAAFARNHSPAARRPVVPHGPVPAPSDIANVIGGRVPSVPADVQIALTVIGDRNASFDGSVSIDLSNTNLDEANFGGMDFRRVIFFGSDLLGANLTQAQLDGADFQEADLFAASLFQASLVGAQFNAANLVNAILREADLTDADFGTLYYRSLKFDGANLSTANFSGADVKGANFKGANLSGAIGLGSK
jgi:hypothetical protein